MTAATWAVYVATFWFLLGIGAISLWNALKSSVKRHRRRRADAGFALLEVAVAIAVLGIVAVPLADMTITLVRTIGDAEMTAHRVALATTGTSIAARAALGDPCDPNEALTAIQDRLSVPQGYSLDVETDCTDPGVVVITVSAGDPRGRVTELTASRAP